MRIVPVAKASWTDFEAFFQSKGILGNCWCMAWRMTKDELKNNKAKCRKAFIKERVWSNTPVGLLAYVDNEVIAWCSIAPRETYQRLDGDERLEDVWSIVCFYITRTYRDKGLIDILIEQAKVYARKNGAKYLEAYTIMKAIRCSQFSSRLRAWRNSASSQEKAGPCSLT